MVTGAVTNKFLNLQAIALREPGWDAVWCGPKIQQGLSQNYNICQPSMGLYGTGCRFTDER